MGMFFVMHSHVDIRSIQYSVEHTTQPGKMQTKKKILDNKSIPTQ